MDAGPLLSEIGRSLDEVGLDAVLIGNAAAALQGAPVTTVDFDFLFRKTARNLAKLKALATRLRATILRPYYPASDLYRIVRDDDGLQLDFMVTIHGLRSYEGVRDRASLIDIGGAPLRVASLTDIIKSKRAAGRPRDVAARGESGDGIRPPMHPHARRCSSFKYGWIFSVVAPCAWGASPPSVLVATSTTGCGPSCRFWRSRLKKALDRRVRLAAVARENRRNVIEMVRRWQARPPSRRTHFLRKRVTPQGTAL